MVSRLLTVTIGLNVLFAGCNDASAVDEHCPLASEECGAHDYDGDGVTNDADDFPEDESCAVRDDENCTACGAGCEGVEVCDGVGACVCGDPHYALPGCTSCLPEFTGANCEECSDPHYAQPECTSCLPEFTGANCDECSDPTHTGANCDECSDPHYAQPECTSCLPEFTGANCDECSDPTYTGANCDECSDPTHTGANCDECSDPHYAQPECTGCLPQFTGANCDECSDSTYTGASCDECSDPTRTGANCNEVVITAGTFMMGSPESEPCREDDETQHEVTLTRSFAMNTTEVTQAEWVALMDTNPSGFTGCADCPVERANWYEVLAYCNALSGAAGLEACYTLSGCNGESPGDGMMCTDVTVTGPDGDPYGCEGYRLPTEAEWEYAARAGTLEATYNGDIASANCHREATVLESIAWYDWSSSLHVHPVAQKDANPWGLYDMLGNVSEWVWDRGAAYPAAVTDPVGSTAGRRVFRGGGWGSTADLCRAARRRDAYPSDRGSHLGFRPARSLP